MDPLTRPLVRPFLLRAPLLLLLVVTAHARASAAQPAAAPVQQPDLAAIERRLTDAARQSPASVEAHYALATFYLHTGRLDASIPHLERVQALDPAHYPSGYDLALAWLETGSLEKARARVSAMLKMKDTGELHNLLGDIEERAGNLLRAAESYQRAAHMDATEEHLFDWGNNLVQLRALDPAIEVFTAAVARHPGSARLHVGLGIARYSRGEYRDAVQSFCDAVDLAPDDPRPYQFLGEVYGVAPELTAEVTERLARFAAARPDNALANLHYAMSLWKGAAGGSQPVELGRVESLLKRAVELDPTLTKGFFELGVLLSDQRRYEEAIEALTRAVRLEPGLAQAHYRLAQVYHRTGQKALAARELEIFEKLKESAR
jgi:tetratricopeptide (TPR) repeat protein